MGAVGGCEKVGPDSVSPWLAGLKLSGYKSHLTNEAHADVAVRASAIQRTLREYAENRFAVTISIVYSSLVLSFLTESEGVGQQKFSVV